MAFSCARVLETDVCLGHAGLAEALFEIDERFVAAVVHQGAIETNRDSARGRRLAIAGRLPVKAGYRITTRPTVPGTFANEEQHRFIEYLRTENQMLMEKIGEKRKSIR